MASGNQRRDTRRPQRRVEQRLARQHACRQRVIRVGDDCSHRQRRLGRGNLRGLGENVRVASSRPLSLSLRSLVMLDECARTGPGRVRGSAESLPYRSGTRKHRDHEKRDGNADRCEADIVEADLDAARFQPCDQRHPIGQRNDHPAHGAPIQLDSAARPARGAQQALETAYSTGKEARHRHLVTLEEPE